MTDTDWIMDEPVVVHEIRTVNVMLPGGCVSRTRSGASPIWCLRGEIVYDIPTGELRSLCVWGLPPNSCDIQTRYYAIDWRTHATSVVLPEWLAALVEQYRPATRTSEITGSFSHIGGQ